MDVNSIQVNNLLFIIHLTYIYLKELSKSGSNSDHVMPPLRYILNPTFNLNVQREDYIIWKTRMEFLEVCYILFPSSCWDQHVWKSIMLLDPQAKCCTYITHDLNTEGTVEQKMIHEQRFWVSIPEYFGCVISTFKRQMSMYNYMHECIITFFIILGGNNRATSCQNLFSNNKGANQPAHPLLR